MNGINMKKKAIKVLKDHYKNKIKIKEESLKLHIKEMDKLRIENKQLRKKVEELEDFKKHCGVLTRENLNPKFLKIVDDIEKNLNRNKIWKKIY